MMSTMSLHFGHSKASTPTKQGDHFSTESELLVKDAGMAKQAKMLAH